MKKLFPYMMACGAMMTAVLGFTSCEDELDVQQAYPFTVETMPVPKRLVQGETAEIRCEIVREGYFSDTRYTIRYFQPDGEGLDFCLLHLVDPAEPYGVRALCAKLAWAQCRHYTELRAELHTTLTLIEPHTISPGMRNTRTKILKSINNNTEPQT